MKLGVGNQAFQESSQLLNNTLEIKLKMPN